MDKKKEEKEKKYKCIMYLVCTKCGEKTTDIRLCVKCNNDTFSRVYRVIEDIKTKV